MFPDDQNLKNGLKLDASDMDALIAETAARTSCGMRVICVPCQLTQTSLLAVTEMEHTIAKAQLTKYLARADLRLLPLLSNGHSVLLTFTSPEAPPLSERPALQDTAPIPSKVRINQALFPLEHFDEENRSRESSWQIAY